MNKLEQIGKRVWYLPAHSDPTQVQPLVGVIVGDRETVLIDAGNTPRTAQTVLSELERIGAPPVGKLIYTHHHWDHVFGGCVYGAEAIAHTLCRTQLEREALRPWSEAFLAEAVARDPKLEGMANVLKLGVEDWEEFRIVVPKVSFDASYVVQGKGYRLELEHVRGKHAADSVVVNVPDARVMFLGDSFYPPPLRLELSDKSLDLEMLKGFWRKIASFISTGTASRSPKPISQRGWAKIKRSLDKLSCVRRVQPYPLRRLEPPLRSAVDRWSCWSTTARKRCF